MKPKELVRLLWVNKVQGFHLGKPENLTVEAIAKLEKFESKTYKLIKPVSKAMVKFFVTWE